MIKNTLKEMFVIKTLSQALINWLITVDFQLGYIFLFI